MYSEKMRNVEPTGRTPPCSARPLRMAPIACSRTPKWMFRPPQFPAATSPPFLKTTLVEPARSARSEEHTSELQSRLHLVCRLLLEKKKRKRGHYVTS